MSKKELRVTITVRNALLLRAIEAAGYTSIAKFARESGASYHATLEYIALTRAPYNREGTLAPSAAKISEALRALPEDLFPADFLRRAMRKNRVSRDIDARELGGLLHEAPKDPEAALAAADAVEGINKALASLRERDAQVLRMRFGLDGYETHTLEEIARALKTTRERVRQIEGRALRSLKHPVRAAPLRALCAPILEGAA